MEGEIQGSVEWNGTFRLKGGEPMAAAFKVEYLGRGGFQCPTCVIPFDSPGDCVAKFAERIKEILVNARGGDWKPHDITIKSIEYIGPWFTSKPPVSEKDAEDHILEAAKAARDYLKTGAGSVDRLLVQLDGAIAIAT